jgi:hypothetical protein
MPFCTCYPRVGCLLDPDLCCSCVDEHLGSPDEGPARVRAAVILVDETGHGIEIMGVHGHDQRSITSVIRSSPGSQAIAPARTAIVRAVAHESQPLKAAGPGIRIPTRSRSLSPHTDPSG